VQLGERLIGALAKLVPGFLERHRVGLGHAGLQAREGAEETTRLTDVGRLEAQVVVEVGARAVTLLALAIGQPAHSEQVRRLEQTHALVERQALACSSFSSMSASPAARSRDFTAKILPILACYTPRQQPTRGSKDRARR
jgi:hypothetical protein